MDTDKGLKCLFERSGNGMVATVFLRGSMTQGWAGDKEKLRLLSKSVTGAKISLN